MASSEEFPRVLFLTSHAFNHTTGGGVTFSNLFAGWPKDRLATAHNDPQPPETDVCQNYFRLNRRELGKWGPFRYLQRDRPPSAAAGSGQAVRPVPTGFRALLFGENEFPETAVLSPELERWIEEFLPQVLYTILGSNGLMDLIELIRLRFKLPLVVHFMDDWRTTSHTKGLLAPLRRKKMHRRIEHFVSCADQCMGISDTMCDVYGADYGRDFETFHNGVDVTAPAADAGDQKEQCETFKIFYAGALLPFAQLQSVIDVCQALARLRDQGKDISFDIYSPAAQADPYRRQLETCDGVTVRPPIPERLDYVTAQSRADLLLLPVNFDQDSIKFIRYSMPTKVPELMRSGVPVLVYGPAWIAQVDYAEKQQWGYIVNKRSISDIAAAIERLAGDKPLRQRLVETARKLAHERHDLAKIRPRFRATLAAPVGS